MIKKIDFRVLEEPMNREVLLREMDSNHRPFGYEPNELAAALSRDCSHSKTSERRKAEKEETM